MPEGFKVVKLEPADTKRYIELNEAYVKSYTEANRLGAEFNQFKYKLKIKYKMTGLGPNGNPIGNEPKFTYDGKFLVQKWGKQSQRNWENGLLPILAAKRWSYGTAADRSAE